MGLKERQAIAGVDFSWHTNRIKDLVGNEIAFQIDESTDFAKDVEAVYFAENRGAQVVGDAFSVICDDTLGKQAIQELNLNRVILRHTPGSKRELNIDGGVLVLSHDFRAESSSDRWDGGSLRKELESRL